VAKKSSRVFVYIFLVRFKRRSELEIVDTRLWALVTKTKASCGLNSADGKPSIDLQRHLSEKRSGLCT
jgi:hypothetical protein